MLDLKSLKQGGWPSALRERWTRISRSRRARVSKAPSFACAALTGATSPYDGVEAAMELLVDSFRTRGRPRDHASSHPEMARR